MSTCRPSKWVIPAIVGVGLPLLGAAWLGSPDVVKDVNARAFQALDGNAATKWATLTNDGRDATISGTAPSEEALQAAVKAVAGTYGVRTVATNVTVAPPVTLMAPTIESITANTANPEIKGTWQEGVAKTLAVTVAGATYKLGANPELTSSAGNWVLKPTQPLPAGSYDVTAEVSDGDKVTMAAPSPGKLVVELPKLESLPAPTVEPLALTNSPTPTFKGTWPEGKAATLDVMVNDDNYTLGKSPELTSDGAGNWSLTPSKPLAEGMVHVMPQIKDAAGVATGAADMAMATVDITPPAAPVVAPVIPDMKWPYAITGTWAEEPGAKLAASLDGTRYELGGSPALTSDGKGNFSFDPKVELKPGSYDVDFTTNDPAGNVTTQTVKAAIVIADAAPAAPAVDKIKIGLTTYAVAPGATTITGRWSEGTAKTLTATLDGKDYVANKDAGFTTDGQGAFTFAPTETLTPGTHPVVFKSTDDKGREVSSTADIIIAEAPPPPKPAPLNIGVTTYAPAADGKSITGRWSEGVATSLTATFEGQDYVANRDAALATDGKGLFTFTPPAQLAPGTYPVEFKSTDAEGRSVMTAAQIIVPEPPAAPAPAPATVEMAAPTVTKQLDLTGAPIVKGTWPNDVAKSLAVTLSGKTYTLGSDANLSVKDGNWSLLPSAGLKDGIYDVVVTATDAEGAAMKDETLAELEVAGTPPATPTVAAYEGVKSPETITGTYDAKHSSSLKVSLPGVNQTAELGTPDSALTADGEGNWTMKLSTPLAPGKYDVNAESADMYKRVAVDATAGEVIVTAPPPAPATYDCLAVLNRVDKVFPIRFAYDHDDVQAPYDQTLRYYASVLKDARCANIKVEVAGHADFHGSEEYNQGLSERRAQTIIDMLGKDGVDATRLVKKGYSKDKPLDPAKTDDARMKNRRVEITATSN